MHRRPSTTRGQSPPTETELLLRRIVRWPDAELLKVITRERARYSQLVLNAAEAELRMRGVPFDAPAARVRTAQPTRWLTRKHKQELVGWLVSWLVYLLYCLWDAGLMRGPLVWLVHGLIGALLSGFIVIMLFELADYLLRKLRRIP